MGYQERRPDAAGQDEGDASQLAAQETAQFSGDPPAASPARHRLPDGGAVSVEDLAAFRAHLREPLVIPYRGGKVFATPELTAGPTMAHTLRLLQQNLQPAHGPDASAYTAYA